MYVCVVRERLCCVCVCVWGGGVQENISPFPSHLKDAELPARMKTSSTPIGMLTSACSSVDIIGETISTGTSGTSGCRPVERRLLLIIMRRILTKSIRWLRGIFWINFPCENDKGELNTYEVNVAWTKLLSSIRFLIRVPHRCHLGNLEWLSSDIFSHMNDYLVFRSNRHYKWLK